MLTGELWEGWYGEFVSLCGVTDTPFDLRQSRILGAIHSLEKCCSCAQIGSIIQTLSVQDVNYINSPLLDGLVKAFIGTDIKEDTTSFVLLAKPDFSTLFYPICYGSAVKFAAERLPEVQWPNKCLLSAVRSGKVHMVQLMLQQGGDMHVHHDEALCIAAKLGFEDIVRVLLEKGANSCALDGEALVQAACAGRLSIMRMLLDNVTLVRDKASRALEYAAAKDQLHAVKLLIDQGVHVDPSNNLAFAYAAKNGHINTMVMLVQERTTSIESLNMALRFAMLHNRLECVRYLLMNGAEVCSIRLDDWRSVVSAKLSVVDVLQDHGASDRTVSQCTNFY